MTIRATKFTPEVLLSAPRRSAGIPNKDASKILYTVSMYSFESHSKTNQVRYLDSKSGESTLVTEVEGASEPQWLDDDQVILLASGEKGATKVLVGEAEDFDKGSYTAGTIDGAAGDLKIKKLDFGKYIFAVSALATAKGELFNPEKAPKKLTTGRVYSSLFVRHWDRWVASNRKAIWYGTLERKKPSSDEEESSKSQYLLSKLMNALKGTKLECPIPPFGGGDHFDIGQEGIIFVAKDPDLNPATNTKCDAYFIPIPFSKGESAKPMIKVVLHDRDGAKTSPVFSPNGQRAAFLTMRENGYESDKNQIVLMLDVHRINFVVYPMQTADGKGQWDRSPSSIAWSAGGRELYLTTEDNGRTALFTMPSSVLGWKGLPAPLIRQGNVSSVYPLTEGRVFVSANSLIDNSAYYMLDPTAARTWLISSNSRNGLAFGLEPRQVSEVRWPGAAPNTEIHAWVVRPSNFSPEIQKYPLAYLVHGGPQGAWLDAWSTRWNPAVFAEQGYVVVCPNPTGSTGYGQALTDGTKKQWGGIPYQDLVEGFKWIEKNMDYVDTDRAVALGASYGGYMMNWIQGQPLGRKFKALVTHDGVYSMAGQMASEELYFPEREFGGKFWKNQDDWLQWDPSKYTQHWSTPHLIIHSGLDYRLTISEGLSAFNVLQDKGVESKFLTFPDENHWVLKPENSLLWHAVVLDWINGYVGLPKYSKGFAREVLEEAAVDQVGDLNL